ncbi:hypothetical protein [Alicyclobacillus cellulosilyticus]|nr:hypothetical protein [Alicyclobacillus cellulosilyticus]
MASSLAWSMGSGATRMERDAEEAREWAAGWRVFAHDLHGSRIATVRNGILTLTSADGTQYTYVVNNQGQWVRIRAGGGTAVLMSGVTSVDARIAWPLLTLCARFPSGQTFQADVCGLTA